MTSEKINFENKVNSAFEFIEGYYLVNLKNRISFLNFEAYLFMKLSPGLDDLITARETLEDIGFFAVIEFDALYSFLHNTDPIEIKKDIQKYL